MLFLYEKPKVQDCCRFILSSSEFQSVPPLGPISEDIEIAYFQIQISLEMQPLS